MESPDKIYITLDGDDRWSESEPLAINEEYIRKDALVDWLKRKQNTTLKVVEDDLIQEVIDHINEM